ncbi:hypothetical protein HKX48_002576 [Thoreauomyces humboldtii]|nr:hypothetical protein HKX48_002576 [Thoreauomyces humboldtii]
MTTPVELPYDFRIMLGTYERLLYGLDLVRQPSQLLASVTPAHPTDVVPASTTTVTTTTRTINPVFIYPAHISCIKAVAATHRFLATGSTDEHIKLYDLRLRKEVGTLLNHSGDITALQFFKKTHLFTASEDGTIAIVRTSDWEVLKTLEAHKRSVNGMDVHPSGKVLLSVGGDGTLKCWDLAKAACTYSMRMPAVAERVKWSPDGSHYAVLMNNVVQVHSVAEGDVVGRIEVRGRINSIAFTSLRKGGEDEEDVPVVVTGGEDRTVGIWSVEGKPVLRWDSGHATRIKDLDVFNHGSEPTAVITCSSDGGLKVWDLAAVGIELAAASVLAAENSAAKTPDSTSKFAKPVFPKASPIAEYDAKCRLTCLVVAPPPAKPTQRMRDRVASKPLEGDAYKSEVESDFDDQIVKPTVQISFEDDAKPISTPKAPVPDPVTASKKRKNPPATDKPASTPDGKKKQKKGGKFPGKGPVEKKQKKDAKPIVAVSTSAEGKPKKGQGKASALKKFQTMKKA